MTKQELFNLCGDNKKLIKILEDLFKKNVDINIVEHTERWDLELEDEFGRNVFALYDKTNVVYGESDGWELLELNKKIAKLINGWKWDNVNLTDDRSLIISDENTCIGEYTIYLVNFDKLDDGTIETIEWGGSTYKVIDPKLN